MVLVYLRTSPPLPSCTCPTRPRESMKGAGGQAHARIRLCSCLSAYKQAPRRTTASNWRRGAELVGQLDVISACQLSGLFILRSPRARILADGDGQVCWVPVVSISELGLEEVDGNKPSVSLEIPLYLYLYLYLSLSLSVGQVRRRELFTGILSSDFQALRAKICSTRRTNARRHLSELTDAEVCRRSARLTKCPRPPARPS